MLKRMAILLAVLATAIADTGGIAIAAPIPAAPSGSFYQPPPGYQSAAPGTVLRSRPVRLAAFSVLPQHVRAWQLLYRSIDSRGNPMATVTTVLLPAGGAPSSVLSYQVAQDSSAPQCAPSHTLGLGGRPGEVINQAEILLIDAAVAQGFAVSVPDYEGPNAEFGAAKQPGYAVLDGLRAAESFAPLGLPGSATPATVWGYSGGSLASGWTAQVQPSYAPELNIRGVAVGGFVTDLGDALKQINGGFGAGLIPSALPGVLKAEPSLAKVVNSHLTPQGKALLAKAGHQCEVPNVTEYAFTNMDGYLTVPLDALLRLPTVKRVLTRLDLGGSAPTAPLDVYHAVHDELVPIAGTDATVKKYCAGGDSVRYTRDLLSEHGSLALTGAGAALHWLSRRVSSTSTPQGCHTATVLSTALSPDGLTGEAQVVITALRGLLDQPVGPATIF
ncbi:MAG: lipase family protein [Sciscionella sp.]